MSARKSVSWEAFLEVQTPQAVPVTRLNCFGKGETATDPFPAGSRLPWSLCFASYDLPVFSSESEAEQRQIRIRLASHPRSNPFLHLALTAGYKAIIAARR
jgi:hypothetical protein